MNFVHWFGDHVKYYRIPFCRMIHYSMEHDHIQLFLSLVIWCIPTIDILSYMPFLLESRGYSRLEQDTWSNPVMELQLLSKFKSLRITLILAIIYRTGLEYPPPPGSYLSTYSLSPLIANNCFGNVIRFVHKVRIGIFVLTHWRGFGTRNAHMVHVVHLFRLKMVYSS